MAKAEFYTYIHRKADTGEIFYVGKGKGNRAFSKTGRSRYWQGIVRNHGYVVELMAMFSDESKALAHEVMLIANLRSGGVKLCNLTDGGDGISGYVRPQESIDRIKTAWKNPELLARHKEKLLTIKTADPSIEKRRIEAQALAAKRPEVRKKQSDALKGRPKSPEHIAAVAASHKRPEVAAKVSAAIKLALSDPEVHRKRCEAISKAQKGRPRTEKQKAAMADPVMEAKRRIAVSEGIKLWWAKRKALQVAK